MDRDDPRLADYHAVSAPDLARERRIFVAEGRLVVRRLLAGRRFAARSVLVTGAARAALDDVLREAGVPVYVVPQALMNDLTGFNIHRGCLAIGERLPDEDWRTVAAAADPLVVLERVANADNVGAVFRSAAAFGAGAVLLGPACADPLYRKAIRTSMGAALAVPFAHAGAWPDALHALGGDGVALVALTPDPAAAPLHEAAAALADRRVALVVGHEGDGLTGAALAACATRARIPVSSRVDSLNVATAAAIALYEIGRRRDPGPEPPPAGRGEADP